MTSINRYRCAWSAQLAIASFNAGLVDARRASGSSMAMDQVAQLDFDCSDDCFMRSIVTYRAPSNEGWHVASDLITGLAMALEKRLDAWDPQITLKEPRNQSEPFRIELTTRCPA